MQVVMLLFGQVLGHLVLPLALQYSGNDFNVFCGHTNEKRKLSA